jgi:hypothetical protein
MINKRLKITRSFSKQKKKLAQSKVKKYITQTPIE